MRHYKLMLGWLPLLLLAACTSFEYKNLDAPDPDQYSESEWAKDLEENYPPDQEADTDPNPGKEDDSDLEPKENPPENFGEPIAFNPVGEFTAATWNVDRVSETTKDNKTRCTPARTIAPFGAGGPTGTRADVVFQVLEKFDVDIAGLQEVTLADSLSPDTDFPLEDTRGFKVLTGPSIFFQASNKRHEFCPIVYNENKFSCATAKKSWDLGGRKIHWAVCQIIDKATLALKERKFYFGCGHLYSSRGKDKPLFRANLRALFEKFLKPRTRPTNTLKDGKKNDNFILGADFNSYRYGTQQGKWKEYYKAWEKAVRDKFKLKKKAPLPQPLVFEKINAPMKVTKLKGNKCTGIATKVNEAEGILDDLIWSFRQGTEISYVAGSKRSITVTPNDFFSISDHLPVLADYTY